MIFIGKKMVFDGPFISGNQLYFWQHAAGNIEWKFNVINNKNIRNLDKHIAIHVLVNRSKIIMVNRLIKIFNNIFFF